MSSVRTSSRAPRRRVHPPLHHRPAALAIGTWALLLVYLFATACAVWDVMQS